MTSTLFTEKLKYKGGDSDNITLSSGGNITVAGVISQSVPAFHATKNSSTQAQTISGTTMYVITDLDSSYGNSHSTNNKSYFDSSTSRFTVPTGEPTGRFFFNLQTIFGITRPTSGTNWGYLAFRKQNAAGNLTNNTICEAYREVVSTSGVATVVWETLNVSGLATLSAGEYVEPIFSGTASVEMKIHSGNYTSFSGFKVG